MQVKNKWLLGMVVCCLMALSTSLCFAQQQASRKLTAEQMAQRALDFQEVQNLMSRHEYYHTLGKNKEELLDIWVTKSPYTETAKFSMNPGSMIGMKSIMYQYGEFHETSNKIELELLSKVRSDIANVPENLGVGQLMLHNLTTGCIEVAGDGKTAKGMWYSPGAMASVDPVTGKPQQVWMWERYAADFVKEDGQWKIWHLLICTDFGGDWPKKAEGGPGATTVGNEATFAGPPPQIAAIQPKLDVYNDNYKEYSPTKVPQNVPRPPEPYYTFSETFSY
ncbi:MAG: hypothetical protein H6Q74_1424 [Firmicutes bacterium]|nr:hypothetical protein [Bacillota bacterium]